MRLTDVKVRKIENAGTIKGNAEIVLDDAICIHNIQIVEGRKGFFISFPHKRDNNGKILDLVHPINSETRDKIQKAILEEYKEIK